jgi:trk system potassium uptake protein TrkA
MKVLICGAGRVGQGIARRLARERQEVTVVDSDAALVEQVSGDLDVRGVVGHAAHPDVLRAAGARDCEMIIAVTHEDEINMVICKVAQSLFDIPTKIARIRSQAYLDKTWEKLFEREAMAIDVVISPELEVGNSILQRFETPGAIMSASFGQGRLRMLGLDIGPGHVLLGNPVGQIPAIFPNIDFRIVGIGRGDRLFGPRSGDALKPGDRVYLICRTEHAGRLISTFSDEPETARHVIIVGAGNIGTHVAARLEKESQVRLRLIEPDTRRAERAAAVLRRAIVIRGDGLSPDILEEAGVSQAYFAMAVTNDDKVNLLVCNLAKRMGARRALALVNAPTLGGLASGMGVDVALDPRSLTVSQILLQLRRGRYVSLQSLEDGAAEIAEGVVLDASPLKDALIGMDALPEGIVAGAVIRNGEPIFPEPGFRARTGDHIVMFYDSAQIRKAEQFFRVTPDYF